MVLVGTKCWLLFSIRLILVQLVTHCSDATDWEAGRWERT